MLGKVATVFAVLRTVENSPEHPKESANHSATEWKAIERSQLVMRLIVSWKKSLTVSLGSLATLIDNDTDVNPSLDIIVYKKRLNSGSLSKHKTKILSS